MFPHIELVAVIHVQVCEHAMLPHTELVAVIHVPPETQANATWDKATYAASGPQDKTRQDKTRAASAPPDQPLTTRRNTDGTERIEGPRAHTIPRCAHTKSV